MKMRTSVLLSILVSLTLVGCVSESSVGGTKNDENRPSKDEGDKESGTQSDDGALGGDDGGNAGADSGNVSPGDGSQSDPEPDEVVQARVSFVSPANGAHVENPVRFSFTASGVSTVHIEADAWPLADAPWDPGAKTTLEYTFSGTGYEREIVLYGFDAQGTVIAQDTISITVKAPVVDEPPPPPPPGKGTSIGSFVNTYYYVEEEASHSGAAASSFFDKDCKVLAKVPADFARLACIEGTAKLKDGRVLNYATNRQCGGPCKFTWAVMSSRFPWGQGNRANALEPLRSWAVDTNYISNGTILYVEEWDGLMIPKVGNLGGSKHDGCFRADDVGGGIKGEHVDIFAGSVGMYRELNRIFTTRTSFTVYKNSPRCAHLR